MRGQKRRQSMAKEALKMSHIMKVYSNGVMANKDVTLSVSGVKYVLWGKNWGKMWGKKNATSQ